VAATKKQAEEPLGTSERKKKKKKKKKKKQGQ
jgi:hypothetical protein